MRVLLVALACTPAWSYVPAPLRAHLARQQGGRLYLPARTPSFYRYRSGASVRNGVLQLTFSNRVRVRQGVWRWTNQSFVWRVHRVAPGFDCRAGAERMLQMSGNKVYAAGDRAWRCVGGRELEAVDASGRLPDVGLGYVVASGLDVARF
jgi:hypothetical protein